MPDLGVANAFMNGRSQAVRPPKAFRFKADEVTLERQGGGVLRSRHHWLPRSWSAAWCAAQAQTATRTGATP